MSIPYYEGSSKAVHVRTGFFAIDAVEAPVVIEGGGGGGGGSVVGEWADDKASAGVVTDPDFGTTTIETDFSTFTADSDDPTALTDFTGSTPGYSGWLKLVLTEAMGLRFNTYDSGMRDTVLLLFAREAAPGAATTPNDLSDDTGELGYDSTRWSALPDTYDPPTLRGYNASGRSNVYEAGTYWLMLEPYDGADWDTSETLARINIVRDAGNDGTYIDETFDGTGVTSWASPWAFDRNNPNHSGTASIDVHEDSGAGQFDIIAPNTFFAAASLHRPLTSEIIELDEWTVQMHLTVTRSLDNSAMYVGFGLDNYDWGLDVHFPTVPTTDVDISPYWFSGSVRSDGFAWDESPQVVELKHYSDGTVEARIWPESGSRPTTPLVSGSDPGPITSARYLSIYSQIFHGSGGADSTGSVDITRIVVTGTAREGGGGGGGGGGPLLTGPSYDEASYVGRSPQVFATAKSPAGVDAKTMSVVESASDPGIAYYRGTSPAIHVFGADDDPVMSRPPGPCLPAETTLTPIDVFDRANSTAGYDADDQYDVDAWGQPSRGFPDWKGTVAAFGTSGHAAASFSVSDGVGTIDASMPTRTVGGAALIAQALANLALAPTVNPDECRISFYVECVDPTPAPTTGTNTTTFYAGLAHRSDSASFGLLDVIQLNRTRSGSDTRGRSVIVEGTTTTLDAAPSAGLPRTHIVIDRSVSRGTTRITIDGYPTIAHAVGGTTPDVFLALVETSSSDSPGWIASVRISEIVAETSTPFTYEYAYGCCWTNPPEFLDDFNRNAVDDPGCTSYGDYSWHGPGVSSGPDHYGIERQGGGGWPVVADRYDNFVLDGRMGIFLHTDYRYSNARAFLTLPIRSVEDDLVIEFDALISQATYNDIDSQGATLDPAFDGVGTDLLANVNVGFSGLNVEIGEESGAFTRIAGFSGGDFFTQRTFIRVEQMEDAPDIDLSDSYGAGSYYSMYGQWVGPTGIWRSGVHVKLESHKISSTQKTVKVTVGAVAIQQTVEYDDNHFSPQDFSIDFGILAGLQSDNILGPHTYTPYPASEFYVRVENLNIQTTSGTCDIVPRCVEYDCSDTALTACENVQSQTRWDEFDRVVTDAWGVATSGAVWVDNGGAVPGLAAVDGAYGRALVTGGGETLSMYAESPEWRAATGFEMLVRFKFTGAVPEIGDANDIYIFDPVSGGSVTVEWAMGTNPASSGAYLRVSSFGISGVNQARVTRTVWLVDTWYLLRWQQTSTVNRAKMWVESAGEPSTWDVSRTAGATNLAVTTAGGSRLYVDRLSNDHAWFIDYIYFLNPDGELAHPGTIYGGVIFRRQIGDPTTIADQHICLLESAAMVLDWHTRGGLRLWGGELIPWCGRPLSSILASGTSLDNAKQAWAHFGQVLDVRATHSWADLLACLAEGRAVILGGEYIDLRPYVCDDFTGGHAVAVFPQFTPSGTQVLVGDPLCGDFKYVPLTALHAFASAQGVAFYGDASKLYFAVSRAWPA